MEDDTLHGFSSDEEGLDLLSAILDREKLPSVASDGAEDSLSPKALRNKMAADKRKTAVSDRAGDDELALMKAKLAAMETEMLKLKQMVASNEQRPHVRQRTAELPTRRDSDVGHVSRDRPGSAVPRPPSTRATDEPRLDREISLGIAKQRKEDAENGVVTEKYSGLRIKNPLVSGEQMKQRMDGRHMVRIPKIGTHLKGGDIEGDWVTMGVVVDKLPPKDSSKGEKFCVWKLSDLSSQKSLVSLFLFGKAFQEHWKTPAGHVVALLNPSIMPNKESGEVDKANIALSVDNAQKVMSVGVSQDFTLCKGATKSGKKCANFANKQDGGYCDYHVQGAYNRLRSQRMECQRGYGPSASRLHDKLFSQSKTEVFYYGGQSFSAAGGGGGGGGGHGVRPAGKGGVKLFAPGAKESVTKVTTEIASTRQASGFHRSREGVVTHEGVVTDEPSDVMKQTVRSHSVGAQYLSEQHKKDEAIKAGSCAKTASQLLQEHSHKMKMKEAMHVVSMVTCGPKDPVVGGGGWPDGGLFAPDNTVVRAQRDVIPSTGGSSESAMTKGITPQLPLGDSLRHDRSHDQLVISHPMSVKPSRAKLRALAMVQQKGPISKCSTSQRNHSNHNALSEAQKEALLKRVQSSDDEVSPSLKRSKLDVASPDVQSVLNAKSSHDWELKEEEWQREEVYFDQLEKKEAMEDKLKTLKELSVSVVQCKQCRYVAEGAGELCKRQNHALTRFRAVKRFFECQGCKERCATYNSQYPTKPCRKCGGNSYKPTCVWKNVLLRSVTSWFSEVVRVRRSNVQLIRDCSTGTQFIKEDHHYCMDSCAQTTMCGPVPIPDSHLQPCSRCDSSGSNCVTDSTPGQGINNTDFVLYVSAVNSERCKQYSGTVAYGDHCQREPLYNRPIAGFLNFCPALLVDDSSYDHKMGSIFHELVHTLVFSKLHFSYYRDEEGLPRTQRSRNGIPLISGSNYIISSSTLRYIRGPRWTPENPQLVAMVVTPKVVKAAVEHFNCTTLIGAQLEDVSGEEDPHWEKWLFGDEVMTQSLYGHYVVSRITLALFEDSGWYQVDYRYAQTLDWGRGKGCGFVNSSCGSWLRNAQDTYPFCKDTDWSGKHHQCVNSWKAVGDCSITNNTSPLIDQVLPPNLRGTDRLADFCPMYQVGKSCSVPPLKPQVSNVGLESFGPSSKCVTLSKPWITTNSRGTMATVADWGAGCYQIGCTSSEVTVMVGSQVVHCEPGMIKEVNTTSGGVTYRGGVVCPAYEDVCAGFNCYNKCSGNGECSDDGYCLCHHGYFGHDCSRAYLEGLDSCSDVTCRHGAQCNNTATGASCVCLPGFTGRLCDVAMEIDPCASQPCGGRGQCYRTNGGHSWECRCYPGYTGSSCQALVDYCEGVGLSCDHGRCANDSTSPTCSCFPGYAGPSCNQLTDPCALKPCKNGGLCVYTNGSQYQCRCRMGFKGKICKLLDTTPCTPNMCPNGSSCYVTGSNRVCTCMDEQCGRTWAGVCPPSMCKNGGKCAWNGVTNLCLCPPGTGGEYCTLNTTTVPSFLGNGYLRVPMVTDNTTDGYYTITISLKPTNRDGLVFYWEGSSTFMSLGLQELSLVYRIGLGGSVVVEVTDGISLDLGRWHSVTMSWTPSSCALYVTAGGATRRITCPHGANATPLVLGNHAYLGGHGNVSSLPAMLGNYSSGMVGCVSHVEVDGSRVDISGDVEVWHVFQCEAAGPCGVCGGVCRSSPVQGYWCECGPSGGGVMCDQVLPSIKSFNHSYLMMPLATQDLTNITITVTSYTTSGLLLLFTATPTAAGSYMSITLNNTNITVATHLAQGGGDWKSTLPLSVALGQEQDIVMVFRRGALSSINRKKVGGGSPMNMLGTPLLMYVGGVPPWQQWTEWEWWSGCVKNVRVNGQAVSPPMASMNVTPC